MQIITSPDNDYIKQLKKLKMKKYREEAGLFLAEGARLVGEALKAGVVQDLLVTEETSLSAATGDAQLIQVSDRVMRTLTETETSQGVLAVCRFTPIVKPEHLTAGPWIAVDNLADPGNLGTIIRTAWGTGMCGMILLGDCVDPYNSKVVRSSMGGIFHVPIISADILDIVHWQGQGHRVAVAAASAHTVYYEADYGKDIIMIIGSEARGVSTEIENMADLIVSLPLKAGVDSINAAVCAGILMYEILRQQR